MIQNYFKTAWRNMVKRPFYSVVNITGLFAGITFLLLIGAYVLSEMQVNKGLRNAARQYFLESEWKDPNMGISITTLGPIAKRLKEEYPSLVSNYYRWDGITSVVSKGDKHFREDIQLGDSTLLSMYGFALLHGNAVNALQEPYSAVVTRDLAIKYFGKTDIVGETITIQNFSGSKRDFSITGVLEDIPKNSVTNLNENNNSQLFIPENTFTYFDRSGMDDWSNIWTPSYIELAEGADIASVKRVIKQLMKTHASGQINTNLTIKPVPLTAYYLDRDNKLVKRMLLTLSLVAAFILLMAVVNFTNIAIGNAGTRMKEMGLRKVLGGLRRQLIIQFLSESFILVLISVALALVAYPFIRPVFAGVVGSEIPSLASFPWQFMGIPVLLVMGIGLIAGIYPAFVLSSVNMVKSLKGQVATVKENIGLRKLLVGFQFAIALIVLSCSVIVGMQVDYFFSRQLGYEKEFVVSSQVPRDWSPGGVRKMKTIRNEFAAMPQVENVSLSYEIPDGMNGAQPQVYHDGTDSTTAIAMQGMLTDEFYLDTYRIPLVGGDFFDSRGLDSGKVILTERAVQTLGYDKPEEAIGKIIRISNDPVAFTIKGVVKDFHMGSMQGGIQPVIFFNVNNAPVYRFLSFKLKPGNVAAAIEAIQSKWTMLMPGSSFEYSFMDESLSRLYASEIQLKKAAYLSTGLSFIIVLLGVLGLVSISIQKRVKEIGIRKVLGASVSSVVKLFAKEFVVVILIAALVGIPVAILLMSGWLSSYASRVAMSASPFVLSSVALVAVTLLLIVTLTINAAMENPVKSLRTE